MVKLLNNTTTNCAQLIKPILITKGRESRCVSAFSYNNTYQLLRIIMF